MIRSALAQRDDVVDFHLGMDIATMGACASISDRFHILSGDFPCGQFACAAVYPAGMSDGLGAFWVSLFPCSDHRIASRWGLLATFLRAAAALLCILGLLIALCMLALIVIRVSLGSLGARLGIVSRYAFSIFEAVCRPILFSPPSLAFSIFVGMIFRPLGGAHSSCNLRGFGFGRWYAHGGHILRTDLSVA